MTAIAICSDRSTEAHDRAPEISRERDALTSLFPY